VRKCEVCKGSSTKWGNTDEDIEKGNSEAITGGGEISCDVVR
jgi:hypothetical protein